MNSIGPAAACLRLTEEITLGIAGLYASGDLSERNVDLLADLLEDCWQRSIEAHHGTGTDGATERDPLAARRHPRIDALLESFRERLS